MSIYLISYVIDRIFLDLSAMFSIKYSRQNNMFKCYLIEPQKHANHFNYSTLLLVEQKYNSNSNQNNINIL